jgi:hypothetical protein
MSSAQSLDSLWTDPGRNDAVVLDQLCSRCSPICTTIARLRSCQPASRSDVIVSDELDILGGNEYAILRNSFEGCKELFLFYDNKDKVQGSANSGCHLCSLVVEAQEDIVPLSSIEQFLNSYPMGFYLHIVKRLCATLLCKVRAFISVSANCRSTLMTATNTFLHMVRAILLFNEHQGRADSLCRNISECSSSSKTRYFYCFGRSSISCWCMHQRMLRSPPRVQNNHPKL